jgi:hypothetical protein
MNIWSMYKELNMKLQSEMFTLLIQMNATRITDIHSEPQKHYIYIHLRKHNKIF